MTTNLDLERELRETLHARAATVQSGPEWFRAQAYDVFESVEIQQETMPHTPTVTGRWRIPLIAAAAVAAIATATVFAAQQASDETAARDAQIGAGAAGTSSADGTDAVTLGDTDASKDAGGTPVTQTAHATLSPDGSITVAVGHPRATLELYTDALCPICGEFETAYGTSLAQAIEEGRIAVRFRLVDFLNPASASGDYSTRAFSALRTVARYDDADVFLRFYAALFDPSNQPQEQAATDLSNAQLSALAAAAGASERAQGDIAAGSGDDDAHALAKSNLNALAAVAESAGLSPGVPTVSVDGSPVRIQSPDWLSALLDRADG